MTVFISASSKSSREASTPVFNLFCIVITEVKSEGDSKPEDTPSILDILPPNRALRIAVMAVAVTVLYVLSYMPWYLKDRKEKRLQQAQAAANT